MRRLLLIALLILSGCQGPEPSTSSRLRIQTSATPESFDPSQARTLIAMTVAKMAYDGLTRIGPSGQPVASVAETIEISDEGKTYTFHLRESLWSNGQPVTAHDFARAWEAIRGPESVSPHGFMFNAVERVEVLDPATLVVELVRPTPYFLELTASSCYLPYLEEGVYNGPFIVTEHRPDDAVILAKNESYWDRDGVSLDGITVVAIPDETTALALFEQGELDWVGSPMGSLQVEVLPALRQQGKLHTWETAATLWYKLNTLHPPLNHPKVRRALAMALDRQAIVDHVVPLGQPVASSPVPPFMGLSRGRGLGDQLVAARLVDEALEEMGLTREELPTLTLLCGQGRYLQLAQALQQQWREALGVTVELESCEFKVLLSRMRQLDYDMAGKIWFADFNDPTSFLDMYKTSGDSMNETGWENATYAALMEASDRETDVAKRRALLEQAEAILIEEMPVIPLYHHALVYLKSPEVEGVVLPPVSQADFKWAQKH